MSDTTQTVPPVPDGRGFDDLIRLFSGVQELVRMSGAPRLVSISLEVPFLEPLAVLESIYEPGEWHAYFENQAEDWSIAGAEAVALQTFSGDKRCEDAGAWTRAILGEAVLAGDLDSSFAGPHAFFGMSFAPETAESAAFAPFTAWFPRWMVYRNPQTTLAIANAWIEPDSDIEAIAQRIWRAHGTFRKFDYAQLEQLSAFGLKRVSDAGEQERFTRSVQRAVDSIRSGEFEKIVLARSELYGSEKPIAPLAALAGMCERFWGCTCFSFGSGEGASFTGATPERLFGIYNKKMETHALAGSIARGTSSREDADLGRALVESEKDRHEHELVRAAIMRRLSQLGIQAQATATPRLLKLSNIQHLNTRIEGNLPDEAGFFELLASLHPTPAVGGSPREKTVGRIVDFEQMDRGLFAGAVGFVGRQNQGHAFVAIRSGQIEGKTLRLFAGAGIVEASDPEKEFHETDLKLRAMRSVFL